MMSLRLYGMLGAVGMVLSMGWWVVHSYNAPKVELRLCQQTIADMNDAVIKEKLRTDTVYMSCESERKKLEDDINTTYNDGLKQGEANAIFKKCLGVDLFSI